MHQFMCEYTARFRPHSITLHQGDPDAAVVLASAPFGGFGRLEIHSTRLNDGSNALAPLAPQFGIDPRIFLFEYIHHRSCCFAGNRAAVIPKHETCAVFLFRAAVRGELALRFAVHLPDSRVFTEGERARPVVRGAANIVAAVSGNACQREYLWIGIRPVGNAFEHLERFGRLDAVYNVAGISGRRFGDGPLHECTEEGWDVTLAANLKTTFLVSRAALRYFLKAEPAPSGIRGTLLNMTSVLAFSPEPRHFAAHAYAASKGAIVSLTKAMAAYYASHQIRVNAIAPGLVRTPMSKRAQENPEILQYMKTKQPLAGGILDAEDVAKASVFLLSDESRHITGEIVTIVGGWHVSSI